MAVVAAAGLGTIHDAAARGDLLEVIRWTQMFPALVTAAAANGWAPLQFAADRGHVEVVRYLLEQGASMSQSDMLGITALHRACHEGRADVVALMLERGADPRSMSNNGYTPLMKASSNGKARVVRLLLRHVHTDYDVTNHTGDNALTKAAYGGHAVVLRQLLEAGADPTLANTGGRTPLHIAMQKNHTQCVALFREWEAMYNLSKARRTHDAALTVAHTHSPPRTPSTSHFFPHSPHPHLSTEAHTQHTRGVCALNAMLAERVVRRQPLPQTSAVFRNTEQTQSCVMLRHMHTEQTQCVGHKRDEQREGDVIECAHGCALSGCGTGRSGGSLGPDGTAGGDTVVNGAVNSSGNVNTGEKGERYVAADVSSAVVEHVLQCMTMEVFLDMMKG